MSRRTKSRAASLVGRETELARLRRALDDVAAGRGSCWAMLGEPGSGKTRLAAELLEEARARGLAVLTGGTSGVVPAPAYGPVARRYAHSCRDRSPPAPG